MAIEYKPDWEETKQRYIAWWAHEDFGRCALAVTALRFEIANQAPPLLPEIIDDRWLDPEYLKSKNNYQLSRTFYGCEALPLWSAGYPGWDSIPAFLGCLVELQETTGWVSPLIEAGELTDYAYETIKLDTNNPWWLRAQDIVRLSVSESLGRSLPGILAISGSGDILAALRTTNKLLLDVLDCPDYVRAFDLHLIRIWQQVHDILYQLINKAAEGSTCCFRLWSPGRFYSLYNDFSYMISPMMFRDIFCLISSFRLVTWTMRSITSMELVHLPMWMRSASYPTFRRSRFYPVPESPARSITWISKKSTGSWQKPSHQHTAGGSGTGLVGFVLTRPVHRNQPPDRGGGQRLVANG